MTDEVEKMWIERNRRDAIKRAVERLHPESYKQLRQLVKLHGLPAVKSALQEILKKET